MRKKIEQIISKVESGDLAYHDAVDELLLLYNVMPSLPSHIEAGIEAKHYGDEMNKSADKPNGFHELDFYNGTVWLRQMIEGNEA